jgi:uncharacterized protein (DUF2132 family)
MSFWQTSEQKEQRLEQAIDQLRDRYGWEVLHRDGQSKKSGS